MKYNLLEELYHGGILKDQEVYNRLKEINDPRGEHFLTGVKPEWSFAFQKKELMF